MKRLSTLLAIATIALVFCLATPVQTTDAGPLKAVARAVAKVGKGAAKGASKVAHPFRGRRGRGCR